MSGVEIYEDLYLATNSEVMIDYSSLLKSAILEREMFQHHLPWKLLNEVSSSILKVDLLIF